MPNFISSLLGGSKEEDETGGFETRAGENGEVVVDVDEDLNDEFADAVEAIPTGASSNKKASANRHSVSSIQLYGPVESNRGGRKDRLQSMISGRKITGEETEHDELVMLQLQELNAEERDQTRQELMKKKEAVRQLQHLDDSKLVLVRVKDFSYHVPFDTEAASKQTVFNQSVCYYTWQFFDRVVRLIQRHQEEKHKSKHLAEMEKRGETPPEREQPEEPTKRKWVPTKFSDLFLPFEKRQVLRNIDLVFKPGRCYVILGAPGSGKTSLLQAIAGRLEDHRKWLSHKVVKNKTHITGRIEYNGVAKSDDPSLVIPNVCSFVQQLDIHAPYLTVKETFEFAKQCRTGGRESTVAGSENLTIEGLGLAHVKDTFVGNSDVRGVSGGQRRRVTLGEMMEGWNPVACADEISTGLDAAATYDICHSMVDFARQVGTTRIVSLLQPGPETFALFDEVVVLSEGLVVYAGPVGDAMSYFESLGYKLPATVDVADFLQSVATPDGALLFDPNKSPRDSHYTAEEFAEAFKESNYGQKIQEELVDDDELSVAWRANDQDASGPVSSTTSNSSGFGRRGKPSKVPEEYKARYQNSWFRAFNLNFKRMLTLWKRDLGFIIGKTFENVGMAVATGGILFGKGDVDDGFPGYDGVTDVGKYDSVQSGIYSALFMTCLHMTLGTSTSAPDDIDQRPIHYKHGDANFYQTTAFVMGRLVSTLPQRAMEIVSFGIPLYWMVGLDASAESFFLYLAVLLSYTFAIKMMYAILAQVLPNKNNVLSVGTFLVLLLSLFSGFIVYPSEIPNYYDWLALINPFAWAFQALLIIEFTSSKYTNGELLLEDRGFETDRAWIWGSFLILISYSLLSALILSWVQEHVRVQKKRNLATSHGLVADNENAEDEGQPKHELPFVPVDLSFEDMVYEVKASTSGETLRLLNNVSGVLGAGRMCALMGSSGAGKTTLMDVIALRKTSGEITGEVRLNGFPQERISFLRSSAYVEQFDIQQPELTVEETVKFSARLRLDPSYETTQDEDGKALLVARVLEMMELTDICNQQVGSYEEGGLTFEQRKRLAIAVELAASPSIIFLDEPTSGLDSRGALVVMRAMKKIAMSGRTICATIHQPSSAVFEMFDDLLLLKKGGEVVFFGELGTESKCLVNYFEERNAAPIEHGENPAAWMLRQYVGSDDVDWKELFEQSDQFRVMKERIETLNSNLDESKKIFYDSEFATGLGRQISLMNRRVFTIMKRAPSYNLARIMLAGIYAFLIGSVSLTHKNKDRIFQEQEVDAILSTIFLGMTIMGVVSVSMAVPVMKTMRDVFYKHRASGMLDHNSISIAVTVAELPYIAMISVIFAAIYYATVRLFSSTERWWAFWLYFSLSNATYTYFGQAFICLVKDAPTAGALVGALIGYNVFFSGLVVRPQYFTGPFQLGYWTAPGRYAYEGMVNSQFVGLNHVVIAQPESAWWYDLGCDDRAPALVDKPCLGSMDQYTHFFFGGRFDESHRPLILSVLFFCLVLARLLLWFALKKFNYVNT